MTKKINPTKKMTPTLLKSILQVSYTPRLSFYSKLYEAGDQLGFADWETTALKVTLKDYQRIASLALEHKATTFECDSAKSEDHTAGADLVSEALRGLDVATVTRVGYRTFSAVPVDFNFPELVALFSERFLSMEPRLLDALDGKITDTIYRVDFHDNQTNSDIHLTFGPMQELQFAEILRLNVKYHVAPEHAPQAQLDYRKRFPAVGLFADIDVYREAELKRPFELGEFRAKASERTNALVHELVEYGLGER